MVILHKFDRLYKLCDDKDMNRSLSEKLGFVLAGGDFTTRTKVSEKYLLDLERRKFLELCAERKTLERLQSIITTGKVLRN